MIKLGMSKDEVIRLLGPPDKLEGKEGVGLNYISSRGLGVLAPPRAGVVNISCWTSRAGYSSQAMKVRDFAGKTDQGIGMGASLQDIIKAYGKPESVEEYHCSFGLNGRYRRLLEGHGLFVTAIDDQHEIRAVELDGHPFFVATLFQPELHPGAPLVQALVAECERRRRGAAKAASPTAATHAASTRP